MSVAVTLLLAATFAAAAIAKIRAPQPFLATLTALLGARRARPLARLVPVGELILAALLLTGVAPRAAALVALLVLIAFSAVLLRLRRDPALPACHCFGAGGGDPRLGLVRNAGLGLAAVAAAVWPIGGAVWTVSAGELVGGASVAVGVACCWSLLTALYGLVGPGAVRA